MCEQTTTTTCDNDLTCTDSTDHKTQSLVPTVIVPACNVLDSDQDATENSSSENMSLTSEDGSTEGNCYTRGGDTVVLVGGLVATTTSAFTPPSSGNSGSDSSIDTSLIVSSSSNEPDVQGNNATALMMVPTQQTVPVFNPFIGDSPVGTNTQSSSEEENAVTIRGASRAIQRARPHSADSRCATLPYVPINQPRPALPQDGGQVVLTQEVNVLSMHQQNLQVNNQANNQVTNVYTDEAQQLITLRVTAAAAATVAETQSASPILRGCRRERCATTTSTYRAINAGSA